MIHKIEDKKLNKALDIIDKALKLSKGRAPKSTAGAKTLIRFLDECLDTITHYPLVILSIAFGGTYTFAAGLCSALLTHSVKVKLTTPELAVFFTGGIALIAMIDILGSEYAFVIFLDSLIGGVIGFLNERHNQRIYLR